MENNNNNKKKVKIQVSKTTPKCKRKEDWINLSRELAKYIFS